MGEYWSKEKRRKECAIHFGNDNFIIDGITLNAVHQYPESGWKLEQECDFYMDNGDDIFLLRIINNEKNKISFVNSGCIIYIIVETKISNKNIKESIRSILLTVQKIINDTSICSNNVEHLNVSFPFI